MLTLKVTSRAFSLNDQFEFAHLSGDWNPIHLDQVFARRTLAGQVVVHGIHASLWALDGWLSGFQQRVCIRALKVSFIRPMPVDVLLTTRVVCEQDNRVRIDILHGRSVAAHLELEWVEDDRSHRMPLTNGVPARQYPIERPLEEIAGCSGEFPLQFDSGAAAALFPSLARVLAAEELASILSTSRLAGVECPGLHSLLSEVDLVSVSGHSHSVAHYRVSRVDTRFGLVQMQVETPAFAGEVRAFLRPKPTAQASYSTVRGEVQPNEFAGEIALVVGGSRGLGELAAKILAAGGAQVTITYHRGEADAARVVDDIVEGRGAAGSIRFDVLDDAQSLPDSLRPTCLCYFATPFIVSGTRGRFSQELLTHFCSYYVTGFGRTVERLAVKGPMRVLYPSTVLIDEMPLDMDEYVTAKAAGETFCTLLEKRVPGLRIHRPRLPRMATDQTASQLPIRKADPVSVMLSTLSACHALGRVSQMSPQRP